MFNRIRISATLFLILILCGILQIGSNGTSSGHFTTICDDWIRPTIFRHVWRYLPLKNMKQYDMSRRSYRLCQWYPEVIEKAL